MRSVEPLISQATVGLAAHLRAEIARIGEMRTGAELIEEFASPVYAPLRTRIRTGLEFADPAFGEGMNALEATYRAYLADVLPKLRVAGEVVLKSSTAVLDTKKTLLA